MKRRNWIILGIIALAIIAWFGWKALHPPPAINPYKTATLAKGDLTEVITANGVINPVRVVNVGTQVSGTVQELHADYNDRVRQGQLLLKLDPSVFSAKLAASEAALANIRATAALQAANERRSAQLVKQDYISRQDYETTRAAAASSAAQVAQAMAQIRQDRTNLGYTVIRSPVDGVIISRQVDLGQTVAASFSTPTLFQIARDLTRMQIEASVAEADVAKVRQGMRVDFTVDAYGSRKFTGTVGQIRLNPTTQQNVVTYTVIVAVANPDGALLPGMTANATFVVSENRDKLLIPNAALSYKPDGYKPLRQSGAVRDPDALTVFQLVAGKSEPRTIHVGASDAETSEVTAGPLRAGDVVVTASNLPVKAAGGFMAGPPDGQKKKPSAKPAS